MGPSGITTSWVPVRDWWRHPTTVFPVSKYGAVGDGKHDDTAALKAAIAAASAAGNGATAYMGES